MLLNLAFLFAFAVLKTFSAPQTKDIESELRSLFNRKKPEQKEDGDAIKFVQGYKEKQFEKMILPILEPESLYRSVGSTDRIFSFVSENGNTIINTHFKIYIIL